MGFHAHEGGRVSFGGLQRSLTNFMVVLELKGLLLTHQQNSLDLSLLTGYPGSTILCKSGVLEDLVCFIVFLCHPFPDLFTYINFEL